jgi:hypothetical protein
VLGELVMTSSILPDGADPVAPYEAARQNLTGLGFGSLFVANYEVWGDLPNTPVPVQEAAQVPVLVLNATFDLQTPLPWAEQVAEALDQPVFEFDDAAHGIILDGTADPANVSCGRSLVLEFATTGELPAEGSCVGKAPPVDVNLSSARLQALAELAFGTSDPWSLLVSVDP